MVSEFTYITAEIYIKAGLAIPPFNEPFGRNVTLAPPSKVSFNGIEMEFNEDVFGEVSYRLNIDGRPSKFRWERAGNNGQKHSGSAKMDAIALRNKNYYNKYNDI